MYGLVSAQPKTQGQPLHKPWTIASTCDELAWMCRRCDGSHTHATIQGRDTQATEGYTDQMAEEVHEAWKRQCGQLR